jgi:hypothetical protein
MARGKGKGKGKGKVKGRATKKSKGNGLQIRQSKLSRWLGRSTSPEFAPDPDDPDERNLRKNLRYEPAIWREMKLMNL